MCCSDCESMSIGELLALEQGAESRFLKQWLGYTESSGGESLRHAIAGIYEKVEADQILVHSGAEEAVFLFMHSVLSRGDHMVVHWPCYQSLEAVASGLGCRVSRWEAREQDGWNLDLETLRAEIGPKTKVIVINTPHNPTGWLMEEESFRELHRIADHHGIIVFSDEVYRELEYDSTTRLPAACELSPSSVSLGVTSKAYGLPGLRIGWIATHNRGVYNRVSSLKDYTTICSSAPSEFLAEVALRHRGKLVQRNVAIIEDNLARLDLFFTRHSELFSWQRPRAGPIAFPRRLGGDVEKFCDQAIRQAGVLLAPGSLFDHPWNHFRIGFGRRNLPVALERLEKFVDRVRA